MLIVGPVMGRLVTRIGPKPILALGASVSIVGLLLFTFFRGTTMELTMDVAVSLIGLVSLIIPIVNMISVSVPKENTAVGLGMNTMLRNLGGAIGPVLATTIISTYYTTVKLPVPPYTVKVRRQNSLQHNLRHRHRLNDCHNSAKPNNQKLHIRQKQQPKQKSKLKKPDFGLIFFLIILPSSKLLAVYTLRDC